MRVSKKVKQKHACLIEVLQTILIDLMKDKLTKSQSTLIDKQFWKALDVCQKHGLYLNLKVKPKK
jgi:hypothetical protein